MVVETYEKSVNNVGTQMTNHAPLTSTFNLQEMCVVFHWTGNDVAHKYNIILIIKL